MNLKSIHCQNFFNHKETKIDFTKIDSPILLMGTNGAGKSSLVNEAIIFAIFGKTRTDSLDDCIRHDANEMGVSVVFELNGQEIDITRTKKKGKSPKLELSIDGHPVEELLTETQKRIDRLIGLSYDSFRSSILLKQDDADFFIKQKPDDRKKIISEILDLGQYEKIEKIAKEDRANIKNEIKVEESIYNSIEIKDIDGLKHQLGILEKGIKKLKITTEKTEKELNEIIVWNASIKEQIKQRDAIITNNEKIKLYVSKLEEKNKTILKELNSLNITLEQESFDASGFIKVEKDIQKSENNLEQTEEKLKLKNEEYRTLIRKSIDKIRMELVKPLEKFNEIKSECLSIQKRLEKFKNLDEAECPTCFQIVDKKHVSEIIKDLEKDLKKLLLEYKEIEKNVNVNNNEIVLLQDENHSSLSSHQAAIKELNRDIECIKKSISDYRITLRRQLDIQKNYEIGTEKKQNLLKTIKENEGNIAVLSEQVKDVPKVKLTEKPEDELRTALQKERNNMEQAIVLFSKLQNDITETENLKIKKASLEHLLSEKIHKLGILDKIIIACSRKGIPAAIIATVLPEIEEYANYYLNKISHGNLSIAFKTEMTLKSGEARDTLEVEIYDGNVWRHFESFSGGEKFRVSLAVRLALSKVLARRANIDLQLLILDEPAAQLDGPGKELFVETVMLLRKEFSKIIIISHLDELINSFDSHIRIIKTEEGNKVII